VFFINLPIGAAILLLGRRYLPAPTAAERRPQREALQDALTTVQRGGNSHKDVRTPLAVARSAPSVICRTMPARTYAGLPTSIQRRKMAPRDAR
jgi:hypothetical protein